MNKIAIILGTRPEIIKMSPLIKECQREQIEFFVLHTGQHYSHNLDKQMFDDLELPAPRYNLGIGGEPYRRQIGLMTAGISKILNVERPDVVVVQGDTVSVVAGALASKNAGIKVAHHEAGLRSHDISMVEETNRVITDHISDFLFTPTADASKNLIDEGVESSKIHMVGNTIVDAVLHNVERALAREGAYDKHNLSPQGYILASAHRAENVDVPERLSKVITSFELVSRDLGLPIVFSMHPRTKAKLDEFKIILPDSVVTIDPVGFLDLIKLEKNAKVIMTDSGGLQEEAFILRVPCVTLRDNTERPETVERGANVVSGVEPERVLTAVRLMAGKNIDWDHIENPFGDGSAAKKIVGILKE